MVIDGIHYALALSASMDESPITPNYFFRPANNLQLPPGQLANNAVNLKLA